MHYLICFSNFIDDQGKINAKQLRANDVCNLPTNERIGVHWNNETQPIGDSGALLNRFLGSVSRNSNAFPISYSSWRNIPKDYKEDILKNIIQVRNVKVEFIIELYHDCC